MSYSSFQIRTQTPATRAIGTIAAPIAEMTFMSMVNLECLCKCVMWSVLFLNCTRDTK